MNNDFIMSPKVDFAFKEIMTNEKVRTGFLSAVLNIPVEKITNTVLLNTNMRKIHEDEKQSILDVRLFMNDNTEIDIEIQLSYMKTWAERSVFYTAKMLTDQTEIDRKYSNLKKCISISILDFDYIKTTDRFHTCYHMREDSDNSLYTDILECHVIELPKLPKISDGSTLYDWVEFINCDNREEFKMIAQRNDFINEAYKQLDIISQDAAKRIEYTARQKAIYDYNTVMAERFDDGMQQGIQQGITAGKVDGVDNLITQFNFSLSDALKAMKITESEYNEFKKH